jgi:hypothetical protein
VDDRQTPVPEIQIPRRTLLLATLEEAFAQGMLTATRYKEERRVILETVSPTDMIPREAAEKLGTLKLPKRILDEISRSQGEEMEKIFPQLAQEQGTAARPSTSR